MCVQCVCVRHAPPPPQPHTTLPTTHLQKLPAARHPFSLLAELQGSPSGTQLLSLLQPLFLLAVDAQSAGLALCTQHLSSPTPPAAPDAAQSGRRVVVSCCGLLLIGSAAAAAGGLNAVCNTAQRIGAHSNDAHSAAHTKAACSTSFGMTWPSLALRCGHAPATDRCCCWCYGGF